MDFEDFKKRVLGGENEPNERTKEVSQQLLKMGHALLEEGSETDNTDLLQAGNIIALVSGVMLTPDKMHEFSNHVAMFSAREILTDLMESPLGGILKGPLGGGMANPGMGDILKEMEKRFFTDEDEEGTDSKPDTEE
jgi:hypothetical protein